MKRLPLILLFLLCWTISAEAASRFAVCVTACTWDNSSTHMWSATSGGATGQSAPTSSDAVTLDGATCVGGVTCTITVNADVQIASMTMGACTASTTGCILDFSANNNSPTVVGIFNNSGSGTRNLKMGNGTWTMQGTGTVWNFGTTTNLTFNANSSTLLFTATNLAKTFSTTNLTYSTIQIASSASGSPVFNFSNSVFTVANLIVGAGMEVKFLAGGAYTTTTSFQITGGGASSVVFFDGQANTFANSGTVTMTRVAIRDATFTGTSFTATSSTNLGNVSGASFSDPSTGGGCILGGYLFWRDLPDHINDNFPAWIERAG